MPFAANCFVGVKPCYSTMATLSLGILGHLKFAKVERLNLASE